MKSTLDIDSALRSDSVAENRSRRAVRLTELLSLVPLQTVHGPRDVSIHGVTSDSRNVKEGFLFVAIEGETTDGHLFVDDAVARGAVAIVSERVSGRDRVTWVQTPDARQAAGVLSARAAGDPATKMDFVGITGTILERTA